MPMPDALTAALQRVAAREAMSGWQPIETAPKDGTEVDLGGVYTNNYEWGRFCGAHWHCGRWHGPWCDGPDLPEYFRPTHWIEPPDRPNVFINCYVEGSDETP